MSDSQPAIAVQSTAATVDASDPDIIDERAKLELDKRIDLYKFYCEAYAKGAAFFLGINSFLLKFAIDEAARRDVFVIAGLGASAIVLAPILFYFSHEKVMRTDFARLTRQLRIPNISTGPFRLLIMGTFAFWCSIVALWAYVWNM